MKKGESSAVGTSLNIRSLLIFFLLLGLAYGIYTAVTSTSPLFSPFHKSVVQVHSDTDLTLAKAKLQQQTQSINKHSKELSTLVS